MSFYNRNVYLWVEFCFIQKWCLIVYVWSSSRVSHQECHLDLSWIIPQNVCTHKKSVYFHAVYVKLACVSCVYNIHTDPKVYSHHYICTIYFVGDFPYLKYIASMQNPDCKTFYVNLTSWSFVPFGSISNEVETSLFSWNLLYSLLSDTSR